MEGIKTFLKILAMAALTFVMFSLTEISNRSDDEQNNSVNTVEQVKEESIPA
jgi:hypothetical protein